MTEKTDFSQKFIKHNTELTFSLRNVFFDSLIGFQARFLLKTTFSSQKKNKRVEICLLTFLFKKQHVCGLGIETVFRKKLFLGPIIRDLFEKMYFYDVF